MCALAHMYVCEYMCEWKHNESNTCHPQQHRHLPARRGGSLFGVGPTAYASVTAQQTLSILLILLPCTGMPSSQMR